MWLFLALLSNELCFKKIILLKFAFNNYIIKFFPFIQQLYKSKEHELEMEIHARKLIERESSRLVQQTKALSQEIKALTERAKCRKVFCWRGFFFNNLCF